MTRYVPFQSIAAPVFVPPAVTSIPHYVVLVEIDWDDGTEGYAYERYRTPNMDYQDLLLNVSPVERSGSPFGEMQFPSVTLEFANRDLYFSIKLNANAPHRGRRVRIKVLPPFTAISHGVVLLEGSIARAKLKGGVFTLEVVGNNFEALFGSDMAHRLPILENSTFEELPEDQVAAMVPIVYGRVNSASGEDLADPQVAPGVVPGYLIAVPGDEEATRFTWTGYSSTGSVSWTSVAWSPTLSLFAAVGASGSIMTSGDGQTWTSRSSPEVRTWKEIIWCAEHGVFVAVGDSSSAGIGIMRSSDGITWSSASSPGGRDWRGLTYSPELDMFVAVAASGTTTRIMTSTNGGVTWTLRNAPADQNWNDVIWGAEPGLFVAVSDDGTSQIMISADGITWSLRTGPGARQWFGVGYSPELEVFMAVGQSGTEDRTMISEDGITWVFVRTPYNLLWAKPVWAPELHMWAVISSSGDGHDVMTSYDSVNWEPRHDTPGTSVWRGLCWAPEYNQFCAVGNTLALGVMLSPVSLTRRFQYALGTGQIAGTDGEIVAAFNYQDRIPGERTIELETIDDTEVSVVWLPYDLRDEERPDEQEFTFHAGGIVASPTDTDPIINPSEALEHLLTHYGGFVPSQIQEASADEAWETLASQQQAAEETGGVAPASLGLVVTDMHENLRGIIESACRSHGMMVYQTWDGKMGIHASPLELEDPIITFDDENAIVKDSFELEDPAEVATILQMNYAARWTKPYGNQPETEKGNDYIRSTPYPIPGARRDMFPNDADADVQRDLDMPYCRRMASAISTARAIGEYLHPSAQFINFEVPLAAFDALTGLLLPLDSMLSQIDIGKTVAYRHWQSTLFVQSYTVRILGISLVLEPAGLRLAFQTFKRAPGQAVHDNFNRAASNDLGRSWHEDNGSGVTALQIASATSVGGDTVNIQTCLKAASGTLGFATWNEVLETEDQMSSIQILYRVPGTDFKVGCGVRLSGSTSEFYGYYALLEETSGVQTLNLYVASGINLSATPGTLLYSQPLTTIDFDESTWRNQGDIIEVRATGNRIEMYYFSDIPKNSFGLVAAVTDNTLLGGQFGIVSRSGGDVYMTNFYGRDY